MNQIVKHDIFIHDMTFKIVTGIVIFQIFQQLPVVCCHYTETGIPALSHPASVSDNTLRGYSSPSHDYPYYIVSISETDMSVVKYPPAYIFSIRETPPQLSRIRHGKRKRKVHGPLF